MAQVPIGISHEPLSKLHPLSRGSSGPVDEALVLSPNAVQRHHEHERRL